MRQRGRLLQRGGSFSRYYHYFVPVSVFQWKQFLEVEESLLYSIGRRTPTGYINGGIFLSYSDWGMRHYSEWTSEIALTTVIGDINKNINIIFDPRRNYDSNQLMRLKIGQVEVNKACLHARKAKQEEVLRAAQNYLNDYVF